MKSNPVLMEHPPKQGLKQHQSTPLFSRLCVLMEHPPKQGLKQGVVYTTKKEYEIVLMEHPPKQGLKQKKHKCVSRGGDVLMEHPPKQGLKRVRTAYATLPKYGFNGTSTKTRIETLLCWLAF